MYSLLWFEVVASSFVTTTAVWLEAAPGDRFCASAVQAIADYLRIRLVVLVLGFLPLVFQACKDLLLQDFIKRHPFPGPGLAVRVLGDVTREGALDLLRQVDDVYVSAIRRHGLYDEIWQARASFFLNA